MVIRTRTLSGLISRFDVDLTILSPFKPLKTVKESMFASLFCFELIYKTVLEMDGLVISE